MFRHFYLKEVGDFYDNHGDSNVVPIDDQNRDEAVRIYWTMYGIKVDDMSEALIDFKHEAKRYAERICNFFNRQIKLIDMYKSDVETRIVQLQNEWDNHTDNQHIIDLSDQIEHWKATLTRIREVQIGEIT